jgi:hypothetical protein
MHLRLGLYGRMLAQRAAKDKLALFLDGASCSRTLLAS